MEPGNEPIGRDGWTALALFGWLAAVLAAVVGAGLGLFRAGEIATSGGTH